MLLWLWCRLAAIALICSLAWELPYAAGVALKRRKKKKKKERKKKKKERKKRTKSEGWGQKQEAAELVPFVLCWRW